MQQILDAIAKKLTRPGIVHGKKEYAVVMNPYVLMPFVTLAVIAYVYGIVPALCVLLAAALLTLIHPQTLCDIRGLRELE